MKKRLLLAFVGCSIFSQAQNPLVKQWDYRFGGTDIELLQSVQLTTDGGFILCGISFSGAGGDKTQSLRGGNGDTDFWIVKTDSLGNKQWDKDFGGTSSDAGWHAEQTSDGGYILGGYSFSGISGDKTEANRDFSGNSADFWIVKTDSLGTKQWDKTFGGASGDGLYSLKQTSDRGYILGGGSVSGISGDKTEARWGSQDFWVVKTDSLGNKQWDKDFGGTEYEGIWSIQQTSDGGYILGGGSNSEIGGDKTQQPWGTKWNGVDSVYYRDFWIVKTDSLGNKQWDYRYGGTNDEWLFSLEQTSDGGYILGGLSASGIGGDKTQPAWGAMDYWIVKIDSLGIKQWDKDFGGTGQEFAFGNVTQTSDNGFLLAGSSGSPVSGNKTEANLGSYQTWALKTNSQGNIIWDKTTLYASNDQNVQGLVVETKEGCYLFANQTAAGIGGDKTQPNWDTTNYTYDYWMIKYCDTLMPAALFTAPHHVCPGSCIDFTNLSANGFQYQWSFSGGVPATSTDVNPFGICYPNPGAYGVSLIASNVNGSDTTMLNNFIVVYPYSPFNSFQNGDTLSVTSGYFNYQWYYNGVPITGATDYFYIAPQSGDYNVVATDNNGCEVEADVFNVIANTEAVVINQESLVISPNPVTDKFTIHHSQVTSGTCVSVSIYNSLGEKVYSATYRELYAARGGVNCEKWPAGLYFLEMTTTEKFLRAKFMKQ
jgi:hypothetical protein